MLEIPDIIRWIVYDETYIENTDELSNRKPSLNCRPRGLQIGNKINDTDKLKTPQVIHQNPTVIILLREYDRATNIFDSSSRIFCNMRD